ncbi:hypothetical protein JCM9279_003447 [Rhodotorula babjevae]
MVATPRNTRASPAPTTSASTSTTSSPSQPPLPRPPPMLRAPPAQQQHQRQGRGYVPPSQLAPGAALPPPPRPGPLVRPPPLRQGQPASHRNFDKSSAGGAVSHVGYAAGTLDGSAKDSERGGGLSGQQARKRERWGDSYVPAEETIRNDYSGQYVQTGARPQNHLRNTAVEARFNEYPKLATLLAHKHALTSSTKHSVTPTYLNLLAPIASSADQPDQPVPSPTSSALSTLGSSRFDCILLTPPPSVTYDELAALDLPSRASTPSFVWLWVGSGQAGLGGVDGGGIGLEQGRELLASWGYRRCEDIVWLKTNRRDPESELVKEPVSLFNPTLEHCLMGIRGTVRRSTDSFLVHCNVDTDVIVWEGDPLDPDLKPPELQSLIENFCLGTRRLHLYGSSHALRRGWLTVAAAAGEETYSAASDVRAVEGEGEGDEQRARWGEPREWSRDEWEARWKRPGAVEAASAGAVEKVESLLPFVDELDALRPKSPPPRNGLPSSGGLGRGRGAGLGITRSGLVPNGPTAGAAPPQNGLGRGRGRGRRDAYGPGPALVGGPSGQLHGLPARPGPFPQLGHEPAHAFPPSTSMQQQQPHLGPPSRGGPQRFLPQQPPFLPPPPGSYTPYQPDAHLYDPYQQAHWQPYPHHQHMPPYPPQVGPGGFPPPPPMHPHQHIHPHPHAYAPSALPHVDAMAVQAHLAMLQQQQHALTAHLAALQLAAPAPASGFAPGTAAGAPASTEMNGGQGLVYPIGGPRDAFEDARE